MILVGQHPSLIAAGFVATVAWRVIYIGMFISSGSVLPITLTHAVGNTARTMVPGSRQAFEMLYGALGYAPIILVAIAIVVLTERRLIS